MDLVVRTDEDFVTTLTLNRPEKLNALTPALFEQLREHLEDIADEDAVRVVVLAGAGRSFCAGNDLGGIAERKPAEPGKYEQSETVDLLETLPQPVICRIQGHCFTGGLELALGCDILIAADDAKVGDTHGQWGLVPIWGMSVRLPERVGRSKAKELMFTSRRISGADAAEIGLVDRAVPAADLDRAVADLAAEIAKNSPYSNRINKKLIASGVSVPRETALLLERTRPFGVPADMAERMSRGI